MNKPLIAAVFGITFALGGAYTLFGSFGGKGPAVVASVSVAPISSGQDSQAKLAPFDSTFTDTSLANLQAATQQLEATLQRARSTAPGTSTNTTTALNSDVQNLVNQVQQVVQSNQQTQFETSPSATSTNTSTSINGVTTTATTSAPSTSFATTTSATTANDALTKAIDAYNQAVAKVTALDLPADVKAALIDYMTALRTQLLALSVPDQFNAAQAQAMTSNPAVDALNKFLANVNGLNMTSADKTKTFAALLASFSTVPGVNTAYTPGTNIAPSTALTAATSQELSQQINAQIKSSMDKAMANLEAQRKYSASLQSETTSGLLSSQLAGMSPQDFTNTVLGSLNFGVLNQAH